MSIDKNKITTQDELDEKAPIDQVDERVDAEMKEISGRAKKAVAEGLNNKKLAKRGRKLERQGHEDLEKLNDQID